ncbi:MAG: glycosyltransferase family 2 protein [Dehalococcoidales bacterium]|nr:glycosyltransferase family 2 protein [Dehalococcoidales bacterium]
MGKAVSVIVPTYNEKDNVARLVERIHTSLSDYDYEVVFIDDNSKDGTADLIQALSGKYPVKVVVRKDKRGLASAVADGISYVSGEFVIVMDADLQHPPEVLPDIFKALKNHEFVMASRYIKGGSPGQWTLSRRIVSLVANLLALPLAFKVKDRVSGFFGFRRASVDAKALNPLGWKIGLEILVRGRFGLVSEVPYTFARRSQGTSKLSKRIIWQYIRQLVKLYSYKFQILDFMIVGGIGYIINIALYSLLTLLPALKTFEFNQLGKPYYLPPFIVSSLVAIISNYLMNRAWTFRGWKERKGGFGRYLLMGLATLLLDMGFLFVLVEYCNFSPVPAAALAIFIVFLVRFIIARSWIWKRTPNK